MRFFFTCSYYVSLLVAFAVGGLLGDVFLHLLPEAYQQVIIDISVLADGLEYLNKTLFYNTAIKSHNFFLIMTRLCTVHDSRN
jgi:hypothetical protein